MQSNKKRLAVNTLFLYTRSVVVLLVSLYTSRLVLNALGISDFGIHSAVTGLVTLFGAFTGSLSAAITRFMTFELGKPSDRRLSCVFLSAMLLQLAMTILAVIVLEFAGDWFLHRQMSIPAGREEASSVVLQCTVFIFALNLLVLPFRAAVIAYERMNVLAALSILDVLLKLAAILCIAASGEDRLVLFSFGLLAAAAVNFILYALYCRRSFPECFSGAGIDKKLLREIGAFMGWNSIGSVSAAFNSQGVSVLYNIFFGVTLNAARGVAMQVEGGIVSLTASFTAAMDPQITKSYAAGNRDYLLNLIYRGSKYAYFLLFFLSLPLFLETEYILKLWLVNVPPYALELTRLSILSCLLQILSTPLITASLATGRIRTYQIIVGGINALIFPASWAAFIWGAPPQAAYLITIVFSGFCLVARLWLLRTMIGLSARRFVKTILRHVVPVTMLSAVAPAITLTLAEPSFWRLFAICIVSVISTVVAISTTGLEASERNFVKVKLIQVAQRLTKHRSPS